MKSELILFRKNRNMSCEEMARELNISLSYYWKIEKGERNPSYNFLDKLKKIFPEINIDRIFFNPQLHKTCNNLVKK